MTSKQPNMFFLKYALLRKEFAEIRKHLRERSGEIKRILIFFGGSDPSNETQKSLDALLQLNRPDIAVDVVIGQANLHREQLKQQISPPSNIQLHVQINNMAKFMAEADIAIGAGGSTTWERCCLGLPSLVITIADNQKIIAEDLSEQGYIIWLGDAKKVIPIQIKNQLKYLLSHPSQIRNLSWNSISLVDGKGTERVREQLNNIIHGKLLTPQRDEA